MYHTRARGINIQGFSWVLIRSMGGVRSLFKNSRVESGRSRNNRNLMGRVGTGHEVINIPRDDSSHPLLIRPARIEPTREKP